MVDELMFGLLEVKDISRNKKKPTFQPTESIDWALQGSVSSVVFFFDAHQRYWNQENK